MSQNKFTTKNIGYVHIKGYKSLHVDILTFMKKRTLKYIIPFLIINLQFDLKEIIQKINIRIHLINLSRLRCMYNNRVDKMAE